ncbi:unnamed protein product [Caenorhabditis sp. 36 PRJEB53466]|nr:unnamed protein product [Caenorhabditis sp. 36 PRJEB53466]
MLPTELTQAYQNLTPQEQAALKEVFQNYRNYRNEHEFIAALKQRSPSLGARAEQKMHQLQRKVSGLSDESKMFVENLVATARDVYAQKISGAQLDRSELRQIGMGVVQQYRSLSPYAQDELRQTFPEIFQFLAQARAQGLRGMFQRFFGGGMGR